MLIRKANEKDLSSIVKLLANDPLGKKRENFQEPLPESYRKAFSEINALIEGVRIDESYRGKGLGKKLIEWAIEKAQSGCHMVQLTTDKSRPEALEFYEKLGFIASHEGLKLHLQ